MDGLTEPQARIILALAVNNINVSATAKALHYDRTTVDYRLLQIRRRTGLNPKNFYDLQTLEKIAHATLGEETEHD